MTDKNLQILTINGLDCIFNKSTGRLVTTKHKPESKIIKLDNLPREKQEGRLKG